MTVKTSVICLLNKDLKQDEPRGLPQTVFYFFSSLKFCPESHHLHWQKRSWKSPTWAALLGPHKELFVLHLLPNCPDFDNYRQLISSYPTANNLPRAEGKGGILDYHKHFIHRWSTRAGKQSRVAINGEETEFLFCSEFDIVLLCLNKESRNLSQSYPKVNLVANTNNPSWTPSAY